VVPDADRPVQTAKQQVVGIERPAIGYTERRSGATIGLGGS
jgi:hypothetical protein